MMQIKMVIYISCLIIVLLLAEHAQCVKIIVPEDYSKIQDAINASSQGDTIEIHSGLYNESLIVMKPLALMGVKTGETEPIIESNGIGSSIEVKSDNVTIEHIKVKTSDSLQDRNGISAGIMLLCNNSTIRSNEISVSEGYGIYINDSRNIFIKDNNISGNQWGICLEEANYIIILDNNISSNEEAGLWMENSQKNTIKRNIIANKYGIVYDIYSDPRFYNPSIDNVMVDNVMNNYQADFQNVAEIGLP